MSYQTNTGQMPENSSWQESMKGLGSRVLTKELEDIWLENTQDYDLYEDETQNQMIFPLLAKELELMPEVGDH